MTNYNFEKIQQDVDLLIQKLGGYWTPHAMFASVVEEIGELAREINARERIKPKKSSESPVNLGEELADTIFSLICLANHYQINLSHAFASILQKYRIRDHNRFI